MAPSEARRSGVRRHVSKSVEGPSAQAHAMRRVSTRVVEKQAAAAAATAMSGGDQAAAWPAAGGAGDTGLNTSFLTSMNVRAPSCFAPLALGGMRRQPDMCLCAPRVLSGVCCAHGASLRAPQVSPFLFKTWNLVSDPATDHIVTWAPDGLTFIVHKPDAMVRVPTRPLGPLPAAPRARRTHNRRLRHTKGVADTSAVVQRLGRRSARGEPAAGGTNRQWWLPSFVPCPERRLRRLPSRHSPPHPPPPPVPPRSVRSCPKCSSTATSRRL